jgi:hypothetical protein
VEYERLWTQSSGDSRYMQYLTYDGDANSYIVVALDDEENSFLYIVDAADGSQKPEIRLDGYAINSIFQIDGD